MKGKIIRSTGSWYDILGEDKKRYAARLRGKFKQDDLKVTNPIAVGDNVIFEDKGNNNFVITEIEDRENYIIRKSTHKASHAHLIASNIDQAILVATISRPRTSLGFIDRFLVSAEAFRIPAIIIFNKNDILDPEDKELEEAIMYMYREIGYECFSASAALGKGIDEIRNKLSGNISLVSGHSGVGKSTLLNKIDPSLELKTGEISDFSQKGTHTTTFAEMFILNDDTFIIDTPGIKELGMIDMEKEEISHYFPEMREELGNCRFNNCLHLNEPGCAVRKKLTSGDISESRYASYLSMLEEKDSYR